MKLSILATIAYISLLTVPKGMLVYITDTGNCKTDATCEWGMAYNISKTLFKNVYVVFSDPGQANSAQILATLATYPSLQYIVCYDASSLVANDITSDTVKTETDKIIGAYASAAGVAYYGFPTTKLDKAYTVVDGAGLKMFIYGSETPNTGSFPNAIWELDKNFSELDSTAAIDYHCLLLLISPKDSLVSNGDKITKLNAEYITAAPDSESLNTLDYLQALATYLKTGVVCDATCSNCTGPLVADCISGAERGIIFGVIPLILLLISLML
jgi:hypothetical protein